MALHLKHNKSSACMSAFSNMGSKLSSLHSRIRASINEKQISLFKKYFPIAACSVLVLSLALTINSHNKLSPRYEVFVDGNSVGIVDSSSVIDNAAKRVEKRVCSVTGEMYSLPCTVSYSLKNTEGSTLNEDELYDILNSYTLDYTSYGFGLFVDGTEIAVVENREYITSALEDLEEEHVEITGEESAQIANDIQVIYKEFASDKIVSHETLLERLELIDSDKLFADNNKRLLSDAPSEIVAPAAVSAELTDSNIQNDEELFQAYLEMQSSLVIIDYEVVTEEVVRERTNYETRFVEDPTLYEGLTRTATYGHKGAAEVTYRISSIDGEEVSREVISTKILYEPVDEIIKVGTKPLPEEVPDEDGRYMILPIVSPMITDRYGERILNGARDYHYGLDLAAPSGTPIYAAASGTVIFAQYHTGGFGYCVQIQHADGTVSLYAHCSELLAREGQWVSQGTLIGKVGATGYAFGNHLHLEVIVNGERLDPELFIIEN